MNNEQRDLRVVRFTLLVIGLTALALGLYAFQFLLSHLVSDPGEAFVHMLLIELACGLLAGVIERAVWRES
jgi:hypothetical protein